VSFRRFLEVMDDGVEAEKDQRFMTGVRPKHDVRGAAFLAAHLQDFAVSSGVADVGAMHDKSVTH